MTEDTLQAIEVLRKELASLRQEVTTLYHQVSYLKSSRPSEPNGK